jgi:hypothetical protein
MASVGDCGLTVQKIDWVEELAEDFISNVGVTSAEDAATGKKVRFL